MKKLHSLFIILLLTLNTYGQYFKEHHIITIDGNKKSGILIKTK